MLMGMLQYCRLCREQACEAERLHRVQADCVPVGWVALHYRTPPRLKGARLSPPPSRFWGETAHAKSRKGRDRKKPSCVLKWCATRVCAQQWHTSYMTTRPCTRVQLPVVFRAGATTARLWSGHEQNRKEQNICLPLCLRAGVAVGV